MPDGGMSGRAEKGNRNAAIHAGEKSDTLVVPKKQPNNGTNSAKAECYAEYIACLGTAIRCPAPPQGKAGLAVICSLALGACLSGID